MRNSWHTALKITHNTLWHKRLSYTAFHLERWSDITLNLKICSYCLTKYPKNILNPFLTTKFLPKVIKKKENNVIAIIKIHYKYWDVRLTYYHGDTSRNRQYLGWGRCGRLMVTIRCWEAFKDVYMVLMKVSLQVSGLLTPEITASSPRLVVPVWRQVPQLNYFSPQILWVTPERVRVWTCGEKYD